METPASLHLPWGDSGPSVCRTQRLTHFDHSGQNSRLIVRIAGSRRKQAKD